MFCNVWHQLNICRLPKTKTSPHMTTSIPGLKPIPVIKGKANLIRFFGDPVGVMTKIYKDHGKVGAVTANDASLVCAFGPEINQTLLTDARKFFNWSDLPIDLPADSAASRFGINLTNMNAEVHKRHRRMMQPPFQRSAVLNYRDAMVETIREVLDGWEGKSHIDVKDEMVRISMLVMMRCMFGLQVKEEALELGNMSMEFLAKASSPKVIGFPVRLPGTPYNNFLRFCERLEQKFIELIEARRASDAAPTDVLGMMIQSADDEGILFTNEELVGHTGLLFVAGHETTAFTLIWSLLMVMQHPKVYAELQQELQTKLKGQPPTTDQLRELIVLDKVVKETMRLLPATPCMFMRRGLEDFNLEGYKLPANSKVILSALVTHRMPELYENPQQFLPHRWDTIKPSLYEYLPYGAGPRMCLGAAFADQEIRLALAMILQRFGLSLEGTTRVDVKVRGITMGPKTGFQAKVHSSQIPPNRPAKVTGSIRSLVNLP